MVRFVKAGTPMYYLRTIYVRIMNVHVCGNLQGPGESSLYLFMSIVIRGCSVVRSALQCTHALKILFNVQKLQVSNYV